MIKRLNKNIARLKKTRAETVGLRQQLLGQKNYSRVALENYDKAIKTLDKAIERSERTLRSVRDAYIKGRPSTQAGGPRVGPNNRSGRPSLSRLTLPGISLDGGSHRGK